jgi:hypothetical protein
MVILSGFKPQREILQVPTRKPKNSRESHFSGLLRKFKKKERTTTLHNFMNSELLENH